MRRSFQLVALGADAAVGNVTVAIAPTPDRGTMPTAAMVDARRTVQSDHSITASTAPSGGGGTVKA